MSLKFALLGLIALKPSSGYDIKRVIDRTVAKRALVPIREIQGDNQNGKRDGDNGDKIHKPV